MKKEKIKKVFLKCTQILSIPFIVVYSIMIFMTALLYNNFSFLKYTTNITILMVAFAYALRLENKYLNAIASITFLQFYFIDFNLHLALAIAQTIIILLRTSYSMKAILFGFVFWCLYMFIFDDIFRMVGHMWFPIPDRGLFTVSAIYLLFLSTIIIYVIKRKEKCLVYDIPMVIKK